MNKKQWDFRKLEYLFRLVYLFMLSTSWSPITLVLSRPFSLIVFDKTTFETLLYQAECSLSCFDAFGCSPAVG